MKIRLKILLILILTAAPLLMQSCRSGADKEGTSGNNFIRQESERGPIKVVLESDKKQMTVVDNLNLKITTITDDGYAAEPAVSGDKLDQFKIVNRQTSSPKLSKDNKISVTHTYTLEPFLAGLYKIPPIEITYYKKDEEGGQKHTIETDEEQITVKSILPEEMKDSDIHDIYPPETIPVSVQVIILISAAAAVLIIGIILLFIILKKRRKNIMEEKKRIPAHILAYEELDRLLELNLIEKGELKKFYQEVSNILRRYIENRFRIHAPEQTTEEFLQELNNRNDFKQEYKILLKDFLQHCDLVKFAELIPANEEIQKTVESSRTFIKETEEHEEEV